MERQGGILTQSKVLKYTNWKWKRLKENSLLILFIFCLPEFFSLDYLIGEVYVERIIVKLHETLSKAKKLSEAENIDSSVSFICDVAYNYFSSAKGCLLMPSSEDLLLTLFQLCAESKEKTHLPGNSLLLKCFVGILRLWPS